MFRILDKAVVNYLGLDIDQELTYFASVKKLGCYNFTISQTLIVTMDEKTQGGGDDYPNKYQH